MTVGVLVFPGSNCDWDTVHALEDLKTECRTIWYTETDLRGLDRVILPGGFAYGDYLRSGALAAHAPVMAALERRVAETALPVLGICNGFQILCERGLLPGALRNNASGQFRCSLETVRVTAAHPLFPGLAAGTLLRLPIAHHEGSYTVPPGGLGALFEQQQVFLQYADADGVVQAYANPNGSVANIAGVSRGSVVGLMPHPERAMESYLGSADGRRLLSSWLEGGMRHGA
ncbi:MAG: phosphoribosylformylglycinamidine synthase subunit PurQ [Thermaerobacter sp.]|nr:phosphoribosylformylglycinamidine synthase subunit PurQ [Thermaerobacter sp.]